VKFDVRDSHVLLLAFVNFLIIGAWKTVLFVWAGMNEIIFTLVP